MINGPLLRHTWRVHRLRVGLIALALAAWGFLMPVVYATFGRQLEVLLQSGIVPDAFLRLLGTDPFSLAGAIALGTVHPVALGLQLVYPVGFAAAAIAGERQRGTLEVLLSRPITRRSVFVTFLLAIALIAVVTTAAQVAGTVAGAAAYGLAGRLDPGALTFLALDTVALLVALGSVTLAASAMSDRLSGPIGVGLAVVLVGYVLEVLGGRDRSTDVLVLAAIALVAAGIGLWRFPRRDLAAPT